MFSAFEKQSKFETKEKKKAEKNEKRTKIDT